MYRKSAVQCERLFSSSGYIVNVARSSREANTVYKQILRHLSEKTLVLFTILTEF